MQEKKQSKITKKDGDEPMTQRKYIKHLFGGASFNDIISKGDIVRIHNALSYYLGNDGLTDPEKNRYWDTLKRVGRIHDTMEDLETEWEDLYGETHSKWAELNIEIVQKESE